MGGFAKDSLRADAWLIAGLAALWPCLHATPYYPFALSPGFGAVGIDIISVRHITYALELIVAFACIGALRGKANWLAAHLRTVGVAAGVLGLAGSVCMASGVIAGKQFALAESVCMAGIAVAVAVLVVGYLVAAAQVQPVHGACVLALSYVAYSALWVAFEGLVSFAVPALLCACPAIAGACMAWGAQSACEGADVSITREQVRAAVRVLPWGELGLGLVFVYYGVISVRVFTAMGTGGVLAGHIAGFPYLVTALAGLVLSGALAALFMARGYSVPNTLGAFAAITLVFLGALLLVMAAGGAGDAALVGKRVMVAAEHCFELLLAIVLVAQLARRTLPPLVVLPAFGIVVFALPQLISLDVLYFSGALDALEQLDLLMPVAAVGAFAIMVAVIAMLLRAVMRTAADASRTADDWQRTLVERSCAGMDMTARELDVLVLTYRGLSAKKVAEELYVSESTVKSHLQHAYRKLGVHTKQDLISLIDAQR